MVKITLISAGGEKHVVEARIGQSIMEAAVKGNVQDIAADCGGSCACATCRIYIDDADWREKMPDQGELERAMLEFVPDQEPHVRLSCQIKVVEAFDGLVVRMPEDQHWT